MRRPIGPRQYLFQLRADQSILYLPVRLYAHLTISPCLSTPHSEASRPRGPPKAFVSPFPLSLILSIVAHTLPLHQLCFRPRGPSGKGGNTAQESAYHTGLLVPRPSEPERPVIQLRPEVDLTQHLGPPIVRDSWKSDAQPSGSTQRPLVKKQSHPTSLNPLDHSLKIMRRSSDPESEDGRSSEDEDPPFECAKRRLDPHVPVPLDDEREKDGAGTCTDHGTRLYGKSADIHLVGPMMLWKYEHIKEVSPPDPQPEAHPPDPGTFPKVRRPIYWGPPFPVSDRPVHHLVRHHGAI